MFIAFTMIPLRLIVRSSDRINARVLSGWSLYLSFFRTEIVVALGCFTGVDEGVLVALKARALI